MESAQSLRHKLSAHLVLTLLPECHRALRVKKATFVLKDQFLRLQSIVDKVTTALLALTPLRHVMQVLLVHRRQTQKQPVMVCALQIISANQRQPLRHRRNVLQVRLVLAGPLQSLIVFLQSLAALETIVRRQARRHLVEQDLLVHQQPTQKQPVTVCVRQGTSAFKVQNLPRKPSAHLVLTLLLVRRLAPHVAVSLLVVLVQLQILTSARHRR